MPPKKESNECVTGFTEKETKLLAAAFLSSIATDKYDYDLMATLTNNTAGSLKKMWPPVKKKAMESHDSFAKFLGHSAGDGATAPKSKLQTKGKKRKAADDDTDENTKSEGGESDSHKKHVAKKRSPPRPEKQIKKDDDTEFEDDYDSFGYHSLTEIDDSP